MDRTEVKCNLCGGNKFILVFSQEKSRILKCEKCGLVFRYPAPTRRQIQKFYDAKEHLENQYFANLQKDYDRNNPAVLLYQKELAKIRHRLKPGKVLDIGCAYGVFLDVARQNGWQPYGVEVSHKSSSYARKNFNLNVFCGTLNEAKFQDNFFHLVTMWDVIEHVVDPLHTLKEIHRILKKDGLLLILTINTASLIGKLAAANYKTKSFLYDIQHNYFFSDVTLAAALKKADFGKTEILDTGGAQIQRWQSRKIPPVFEWGANFLDVLAKIIGREYRQVVLAQKAGKN